MILTNNKNVYKLGEELGIDCLFLNAEFSFKKVISFVRKIKLFLAQLDQTKDFFLFDNAFTIEGFWIVANWNGPKFFKNFSTEFPLYSKKRPIPITIKKTMLRQVLNLDLIIRHRGQELIWGIDDEFCKKNSIEKLNIDFNNYKKIQNEVFSTYQIKLKKYDNMWIDQGLMTGIVKEEQFMSVLHLISSQQSFVYKKHPKHINPFMEGQNSYPSHIPSEFLFNNINNAVISVYSLSLIVASRFPNLKVISLLEIVTWVNDNYKESVREKLITDTEGRVLFPRSYDELIKLLHNFE